MRFLLDESADARIIPYLRAQGHDVSRIAGDYPAGMPDPQVLALAVAEQRILITSDLDFGELVYRFRHPHAGVILFRLGDYAEISLVIDRLANVLVNYGARLDQFLVVTAQAIRSRR